METDSLAARERVCLLPSGGGVRYGAAKSERTLVQSPAAQLTRLSDGSRYTVCMLLMLEMLGKEPSVRAIWAGAILLGLVGFIAARFRRWLVLPALALVAIAAWTQLGELLDPRVGPAIMEQAGQWYVAHAGAAVALAVILCVLGVVPKRAV